MNEGLQLLSPEIREWIRGQLIVPRKVILSNDSGGCEKEEYWLVTDNAGHDDASFRVIYDEGQECFGWELTLASGIEWAYAFCGEFSETIKLM